MKMAFRELEMEENYENLSFDIKNIVDLSIEVRNKAYAPYSKFKVGAALICSDGSVYSGCNIENASYPVSICAEKSAVAKAVSDGKYEFVAVAVAAVLDSRYTYPCGSCRQFLSEFVKCNSDILVYTVNPQNKNLVAKTTVNKLLPLSFHL